MNHLLEVQGLSVPLPLGGDRKFALNDVSITLPKGELTCIVGESGSGKSTLARAVMGLLQMQGLTTSKGRLLFEGKDLLQVRPEKMRALRGQSISMIFQEPMSALNPVLRVGAQADEVLKYHGIVSRSERRLRVLDAFEEVNLPNPSETYLKYPHQLSGGQRQRVMIAMALLLGPKLLIADEPTTALDVTTQMRILRLIKQQQREKEMGVLFVTHDFGVVAEVADNVVVMRHGAVVETGTANEVLVNPKHEYTRALLDHLKDNEPAAVNESVGDPVLRATGVHKSYAVRSGLSLRPRHRVVLSDFDLDVHRGETVAIVGESGSGKSTAARCLCRLVEPNGGEVIIDEHNFLGMSGRALRSFRSRIQLIFQDPFSSLNPRMTVGSIITAPCVAQGMSAGEAWDTAYRLLEMVGLDRSAAKRLPHEFSGGQRQRIGIARALALKPDILIADEAVSALDLSTQAQIIGLLEKIRATLGVAIIFITHDLRVAQKIGHRVIVMKSGKIVETGKTTDVLNNPQHAYTRELLASVPGRSRLAGHQNLRPQSASAPAA